MKGEKLHRKAAIACRKEMRRKKIYTCLNEDCFMHGCHNDPKIKLRKRCWICGHKMDWYELEE